MTTCYPARWYLVLLTQHHGSVAPDWGVGTALGAGGLAGSYFGARLQPHLPEVIEFTYEAAEGLHGAIVKAEKPRAPAG
jgi:hypothetical protein